MGAGRLLGVFNIPYSEFRKYAGQYIRRIGYVVGLDRDKLNDFLIEITERWGWEVSV